MPIEIDLLTREIPSDCKVWRSFAGTGYKFLERFLEKQAVFLDLPGLELPDGDLSEANDFLARILAAQETAEIYRYSGPEAEINVSWEDYRNARRSVGRGIIRSSAINLYRYAKMGDLVVVPSPITAGTIYIGAIADTPDERSTVLLEDVYGLSEIPSRAVRWLSSIPEHKLSYDLTSVLRHQNPFSLVPNSLFLEVMSIAYTNFTYRDRFSSVVYNLQDDYLDIDSALIGIVAQISASIIEKLEDGEEIALDDHELLQALIGRPSLEYTCSQSVDIHSEGFNRFVSSKLTPLVIASILSALTYLGTYSTREALAADIAQITVVNSTEPASERCAPPVSEATTRFLAQTDIDIVWEMCQRAREAKRRAGLQPGVTIRGNDRPEMRLPPRR